MRKIFEYAIRQVEPYVNWLYFYHAWQMGGKSEEVRKNLRRDAEEMMRMFDSSYHTYAVVGLYDAQADGDDLVMEGYRIPLLRQQQPDPETGVCLCLADFVRPVDVGIADKVGVFAATVDPMMERVEEDDPYKRLLAQTVADRLAEATVEVLHEEVRKSLWGYAAEENLSIQQMHAEQFQGIRPAVGYPSLPDTSMNFIIDRLIGMREIGIHLTENGAMRPHASVSGLMISHPEARYFNLGRIGKDQLADYARRRGLPLEVMGKFLATSIVKED